MSNLKGKIPVLQTALIPSYNAIDVDEGIGSVKYYGYTSESSAATVYNLTRDTPFSYTVSTSDSQPGAFTFTTGAFNLPRVIKGTPILTLTWRVTNDSGSNNNHLAAQLVHVTAGGTETVIASVTGATYSSASGTMFTTALKLSEVTTPQLVKIGEFVRLKITTTADTAGVNPVAHLAHDPQNRDDSIFTAGNFDTTTLILYVPFRIDR